MDDKKKTVISEMSIEADRIVNRLVHWLLDQPEMEARKDNYQQSSDLSFVVAVRFLAQISALSSYKGMTSTMIAKYIQDEVDFLIDLQSKAAKFTGTDPLTFTTKKDMN